MSCILQLFVLHSTITIRCIIQLELEVWLCLHSKIRVLQLELEVFLCSTIRIGILELVLLLRVPISMAHAQFCCLLSGVLAPGKLLPSPKDAVPDPLSKYTVWLVEFSCASFPKYLKKAVADL